jgi:hypothetical protein
MIGPDSHAAEELAALRILIQPEPFASVRPISLIPIAS